MPFIERERRFSSDAKKFSESKFKTLCCSLTVFQKNASIFVKMGFFSKIIVDCMRRDKFREQNRFSVMSDCFSVLLSKLVSAHQQSQIIFLSTQKMPITSLNY